MDSYFATYKNYDTYYVIINYKTFVNSVIPLDIVILISWYCVFVCTYYIKFLHHNIIYYLFI